MIVGKPSETAVRVCMGRAFAHARGQDARFSDPTAIGLLPEHPRASVARAIEGAPPTSMRERIGRVVLRRLASMMVARTIEIDDAVRGAAHPQVVILGAGLDGRAWRMPELGDAVVFEVDHPDTQRDKRSRVASLEPKAREVRFVPVDFGREGLDEALAAAGHDRSRPTTWIWEGVVMYLTPEEIATTLGSIARRSAPESRLVVMYHQWTPFRFLVGLWVRRLGEPFRSKLTPPEMRALLERYGFEVQRDAGLDAIGAKISADLGRGTRQLRHLRLTTARRCLD